MARLIVTLLLLGLATPAAARFRVCARSLREPEEVDVFRTHLPPGWILETQARPPQPVLHARHWAAPGGG